MVKTQKGVAILTKAASQAANKVSIQDLEELAERKYALGKAHAASMKPEVTMPEGTQSVTTLPAVPTIYPEVNPKRRPIR